MTSSPSESPTNNAGRSVLPVVFTTLFLDLAGFSIIFPLFPAMLAYYTEAEGGHGLVGAVIGGIEKFAYLAGAPGEMGVIVLFGGVLGSLYAFLQFIFAPIFGALSDHYGRRPILLISITGLALSYALWIFAGQFWVLIVARILGGMMSANISTATAIVADVTSEKDRPKGMAIVGMAFGLGFIVGPALGGLSSMIDLTQWRPGLAAYGINPFSVPAIIAFVLSVANVAFVYFRLKETLPAANKTGSRLERTTNPLRLFRTDAYPGVTRTNMTNFVFLSIFAGMEFALTFLAMDRLGYGPKENAYMFLFIGAVLALVQGSYVRIYSPIIGPRRMCMQGLAITMPGLALIGFAPSSPMLYAGLFFMAAGSAQVIPCLTAMVSVLAPAEEQGRILGVFRSLGALARGLGPLIAAALYWRMGSAAAYWIGAVALLLPLVLAWTLPNTHERTVQAPASG